jgi:predicted nucleic acid-binding protein
MVRVVIDTNVIIAAMRSKQGASNRFLRMLGTGKFEAFLSVPLVLEYEEVCKRIMPHPKNSCKYLENGHDASEY